MSLVSEVQTASAILRDWLGDGGEPVDKRIAEHRAAICRQCPENRNGKWWEVAKHPIADVIRIHLEMKNKRDISVDDESNLNMCAICGCSLPLKVHVPLEHILAHTDKEMLERFPKHCWIPNKI